MKYLIPFLIFLLFSVATTQLETVNYGEIIQNITSTSATLLGFTLTALAIMVSMPDVKMLSQLKDSCHYKGLVDRMLLAISMLLVSLISALTSSYILDILPSQQLGLAFITGLFAAALYQVVMAVKDFRMLLTFLSD